eukprot:7384504-Prymnesium_polylepis.1
MRRRVGESGIAGRTSAARGVGAALACSCGGSWASLTLIFVYSRGSSGDAKILVQCGDNHVHTTCGVESQVICWASSELVLGGWTMLDGARCGVGMGVGDGGMSHTGHGPFTVSRSGITISQKAKCKNHRTLG